jgi:carotenoid cleavage dioxygenase
MFATDLHGPNEGPTTLDRWIVDLADGKVRETCLDDHPQEFPCIDDRLTGRPHRYGYAMQTSKTGGNASNSVLKHDVRRGLTIARRLGAHQSVGEFVFVPNSLRSPEDDGVLMCY